MEMHINYYGLQICILYFNSYAYSSNFPYYFLGA